MRKAALMLVLCCLLWGYSFPSMQMGMKVLESHYYGISATLDQVAQSHQLGLTAAFLGWRFGLAALGTTLLWSSARKAYTRLELQSGAILGALLAVGMICQLAGLRYTLPSVSSFITSLSVVFTPMAQALIFKRRVGAVTWLGAVLALIGMTILAQPNPGAFELGQKLPVPPIPFLGEILTTIGAVFFTGLILGLDQAGSRCNPARMSVAVFCSASCLTSLTGWLLCGSKLYHPAMLSGLLHDQRFVLLLLSLTLFSSVLAISIMYRFQRFVAPAVASVIYTTESIFATVFSLLLGTEQLTVNTVLGGTLILGAFILVTIPRREKRLEIPLNS